MSVDVAANLARVRERVHAACRRAGRSESDVTLMAVSKQQPAALMLEAARCGVTLFGENRVQEFTMKRAELGDAFPACVEMIGHLQSNKARSAVELFDGLHSLDSLRLAERVNAEAAKLGTRWPCWIEVKLSDETAKTGFDAESPALRDLLVRAAEFGWLDLRGLMTVPPWSDDAEPARPYFARLRKLRDALAHDFPAANLCGLSMGMSHDFEVAIEEGATVVRVGTNIFGPRSRAAAQYATLAE